MGTNQRDGRERKSVIRWHMRGGVCPAERDTDTLVSTGSGPVQDSVRWNRPEGELKPRVPRFETC